MQGIKLFSLLFLFTCCELPRPVEVDISSFYSQVDVACQLPLTSRNVFDTLQVGDRLYGFCSGACKIAFKKGKTVIPCPVTPAGD